MAAPSSKGKLIERELERELVKALRRIARRFAREMNDPEVIEEYEDEED